MIQYLLIILLGLPPAYTDNETWDERTERMEVVATAIDNAASKATCQDRYENKECVRTWTGSNKQLALLLITKGWWESKFAKNVHEGKCREFECDAIKVGGNVIHKARTPWQMQQTGFLRRGEWEGMVGSDLRSTAIAAIVAARILGSGLKRCKNIHGAMASYGGVKKCDWRGVDKRYNWFLRLSEKTDEAHAESADFRKKSAQEKEQHVDRVVLLSEVARR